MVPKNVDEGSSSSSLQAPHQSLSSETIRSTALEWKDRGNAFYGLREFQKALDSYQEGLDLILSCKNRSLDDALLEENLRSNIAIALIKLDDFDGAEKQCNLVLESSRSDGDDQDKKYPNTKGKKNMWTFGSAVPVLPLSASNLLDLFENSSPLSKSSSPRRQEPGIRYI